MAASRYILTGEKHLGLWLADYRRDQFRFVYVIQGDEGTPIKVGLARDPHRRIEALQTGYPWRLRLLFVLPGDHHLEWYLHQRLKGKRLMGEWFKPDDEFLDYVADLADRIMDAWDGSDAVPYYGDFPEIQEALPASRRLHEVRTRFVDPDPVMAPYYRKKLEKLIVQFGRDSVQVKEFKALFP